MCKVSVIIPYYNSENTILRALNSVANQTYKNFEIILIDDGSIDNSHEIVNEFIKNNKNMCIKNLYQNNAGPSKARNLGIMKSKGEYIALLDADDSWKLDKLEKQMEFLDENKDIVILGTDYKYKSSKSQNNKSIAKKFKKVSFFNRLFRNYFNTSSVIIKKSVLKKVGIFKEDQKYAEDTLLFLNILRNFNGGKIKLPLLNVYKKPFGESGLSSNLKEVEKCELNNFKILRKENYKHKKKIRLWLYILVVIFSYIKYIRRIIIVKLRSKDN